MAFGVLNVPSSRCKVYVVPSMFDPVFDFQKLTEADLPLLQSWLRQPHVKPWWPGPSSLDELRNEYLPAESDGAARPYIASLNQRPVGYIQYYVVAEGDPGWWPDNPGPGTLGIDQFLGDGRNLGRGLGTAMVKQFIAFLFRDPDVTQIRVDPHPENERAVRCYRRAGFRAIGPITTPDGPALMMILDRPKS